MEPSTPEKKDISWLIVLAAFAAALLHITLVRGIAPVDDTLARHLFYTLVPWIWAFIIIGLIKLILMLFKASYVKPKRDATILS
jgi:hypothetical protein